MGSVLISCVLNSIQVPCSYRVPLTIYMHVIELIKEPADPDVHVYSYSKMCILIEYLYVQEIANSSYILLQHHTISTEMLQLIMLGMHGRMLEASHFGSTKMYLQTIHQ